MLKNGLYKKTEGAYHNLFVHILPAVVAEGPFYHSIKIVDNTPVERTHLLEPIQKQTSSWTNNINDHYA